MDVFANRFFLFFFVFFEKQNSNDHLMRDCDCDCDCDWDERRDSGEGRRVRWAKSAEIH